jgi:centrosomal protein CEP104
MATDYQAREMKSVFVDVTTQYLKLVLYQPYANRLNLFDQAGLVSIQVLGEPIITVDQ